MYCCMLETNATNSQVNFVSSWCSCSFPLQYVNTKHDQHCWTPGSTWYVHTKYTAVPHVAVYFRTTTTAVSTGTLLFLQYCFFSENLTLCYSQDFPFFRCLLHFLSFFFSFFAKTNWQKRKVSYKNAPSTPLFRTASRFGYKLTCNYSQIDGSAKCSTKKANYYKHISQVLVHTLTITEWPQTTWDRAVR